MLDREAPEARVGERRDRVTRAESEPPVALARQRQNGVRPGDDRVVVLAGEVDTEERKGWIGHRIDQSAHERGGVRAQGVVVAAERDDPRGRLEPGQARQPVRLQAGAADQVLRSDPVLVRPHDHTGRVRRDTPDRDAEQQLAAERAHVVRERTRHRAVVDHCRLGRMQRAEADGVRLDLGDLATGDLADAANAVRCGAPAELLQPWELGTHQPRRSACRAARTECLSRPHSARARPSP